MPRELITVQVGQCGNQIGTRFWESALREHAAINKNGVFDESMSAFFRNVDTRFDDPREIPVGDGTSAIKCLKARAVVVDMECGVVNEMMNGPLGELFDSRQLITDVSGAGNNWAHGHEVYGPQYLEQLRDTFRRTSEQCDSLQSFFLTHSLGGGTGSGLGSFILEMLADDYPSVYRFAAPIFPSADDDVVTSPYNSMLTLSALANFADCVMPIENQALAEIVARRPAKEKTKSVSGNPWDEMNELAAGLITNLTAGMRFPGSLNVDLNEISMNLVPFPKLHFLVAGLSPLGTPRSVDQMFTDVYHRHNQLMAADVRHHRFLASGLLIRGGISVAEANANIQRLESSLDMIHWNKQGFKLGLCSVPPAGQKASVLGLSNSCAVGQSFDAIQQRFMQLYRVRAHVHHYTEYMSMEVIDESLQCVSDLVAQYEELGQVEPPKFASPRPRPYNL